MLPGIGRAAHMPRLPCSGRLAMASLACGADRDALCPPRAFARVMRGYDPHQVDEYFKQLDGEVRQHREQVQALQQELSDAHRQIREQERPTYAGLGSRIEQLLRLAEEQATEIAQEARSAANELNAAAKVDAAEVRAAAENEAGELRAIAKRETDEQRASAEREAAAIKTGAR